MRDGKAVVGSFATLVGDASYPRIASRSPFRPAASKAGRGTARERRTPADTVRFGSHRPTTGLVEWIAPHRWPHRLIASPHGRPQMRIVGLCDLGRLRESRCCGGGCVTSVAR